VKPGASELAAETGCRDDLKHHRCTREDAMKIETLPDADGVASRAAVFIAAQARSAARLRGRFTLAVSGGRTPWQMLRLLASEDVPWPGVHLFQVDERVAPAGDAERNLAHIRETLLANAPLAAAQGHAMAVEATDFHAAARQCEQTLRDVAVASPQVPGARFMPCLSLIIDNCKQ